MILKKQSNSKNNNENIYCYKSHKKSLFFWPCWKIGLENSSCWCWPFVLFSCQTNHSVRETILGTMCQQTKVIKLRCVIFTLGYWRDPPKVIMIPCCLCIVVQLDGPHYILLVVTYCFCYFVVMDWAVLKSRFQIKYGSATI